MIVGQVLECFELQPENSTFLELIPLFPKVISALLFGILFRMFGYTLKKLRSLMYIRSLRFYKLPFS